MVGPLPGPPSPRHRVVDVCCRCVGLRLVQVDCPADHLPDTGWWTSVVRAQVGPGVLPGRLTPGGERLLSVFRAPVGPGLPGRPSPRHRAVDVCTARPTISPTPGGGHLLSVFRAPVGPGVLPGRPSPRHRVVDVCCRCLGLRLVDCPADHLPDTGWWTSAAVGV